MTLKFSGGYAKLQRCMSPNWLAGQVARVEIWAMAISHQKRRCPKLVGKDWDNYVSRTKERSEGRIGADFHCIRGRAPHREISRPRVVRTTSKPIPG
jgi:hypothetical protein